MGAKSDLTTRMVRLTTSGFTAWLQQVLLGSDTDIIWVYGMALMECGWVGDKLIYVERALNSVSHPNFNTNIG